jgi:hypothetical protein
VHFVTTEVHFLLLFSMHGDLNACNEWKFVNKITTLKLDFVRNQSYEPFIASRNHQIWARI